MEKLELPVKFVPSKFEITQSIDRQSLRFSQLMIEPLSTKKQNDQTFRTT